MALIKAANIPERWNLLGIGMDVTSVDSVRNYYWTMITTSLRSLLKMPDIKLIEENKKLRRAHEKVSTLHLKSQEYKEPFDDLPGVAEEAIKKTFIVLKQFNGSGPLYKVEVDSKELQVVSSEILNELPDDWSTDDFYSLLNEGKRLDIEFETK